MRVLARVSDAGGLSSQPGGHEGRVELANEKCRGAWLARVQRVNRSRLMSSYFQSNGNISYSAPQVKWHAGGAHVGGLSVPVAYPFQRPKSLVFECPEIERRLTHSLGDKAPTCGTFIFGFLFVNQPPQTYLRSCWFSRRSGSGPAHSLRRRHTQDPPERSAAPAVPEFAVGRS